MSDTLRSSNQQQQPTQALEPLVVRVRDVGPLLMVSLFLLLLSFFILLISISTISETKSARVLKAVSTTFQRNVLDELTRVIRVSTLGEVPSPNTEITNVEELWTTAAPIIPIRQESKGSVLEVEVSVSDLFVGGSTKLRADRRPFLDALSQAVSASLTTLETAVYLVGSVEDFANVDMSQVAPPTRSELKQWRDRAIRERRSSDDLDIYDPSNYADINTGSEDIEDIYYTNVGDLGFGRTISLARYMSSQGVPPHRIRPSLAQIPRNSFVLRFVIDTSDEVLFGPNENTDFLSVLRSQRNL